METWHIEKADDIVGFSAKRVSYLFMCDNGKKAYVSHIVSPFLLKAQNRLKLLREMFNHSINRFCECENVKEIK
jgi:hypothetical protein